LNSYEDEEIGMDIDTEKLLAIATVILGLAGAALNAKASDYLIRHTGGWGGGMAEATMRSARRWSWPGWACIAGALVCGAATAWVQ
jgi:hypothetical protein